MWVIFILSALIVAMATMIMMWVGHKIYLSMKRDNRKFERENDENGGN